MRAIPPCKPDCPVRKVGCHSWCPQYAEYREAVEKAQCERDKNRIFSDYCSAAVARVKKNMSQTKGALKLENQ